MFFYNDNYLKSFNESKGIYFGYGCFETIMGKKKKAIFLEEHLLRLTNALEQLEIKNKSNFAKIIEELIELEKIELNEEFMIKIVVTDTDNIVKLERFKHRNEPEGVKICKINQYFQNELGNIKSTSYLNNILARKEVEKKECFEGVFFNRLGNVCEGSISNIFFIRNRKIMTPELSLNILDGIIRKKIIKIAKENEIEIEEGIYDYGDLLNSDAIFLTNSLMEKGLIWVNSFEGVKKEKNIIIETLEKSYLKLVDSY